MMMAKAKKKYPDVESVLEVIRTRDEMGLPLSPGQLNKGKYPDPDLHKAGIRHCGTWQKAVEAAGFSYAAILNKSRSRYPTAASVIREIKDRHKNELPLCATDVGKNPGPHRDSELYAVAYKYFGNWMAAVEAAGFDYSNIRSWKKRRYPDADSVVKEINHRADAGLPLNTIGLIKKEGEHKDYSLYKRGVEYFGSWRAAIKAAGLDYADFHPRPERRYPDAASVVEEIKCRANLGLPLNGTKLEKRGKYQDVALYTSGSEYFGSWRAAVEAASVDFKTLRPSLPRMHPDGASVVTEIQRRVKANIPVNSAALKAGKHRSKILLNRGREYFGSWPAALEAAGLSYEEVRCKPSRRYPDAASVVAEIKCRHKAGLPLGSIVLVKKGSDRDPTLCIRAREFFGRWRTALKAAGVEVEREYKCRHLTYPPRRYPDKASVVAEIRRREAEGLALNATGVSKGNNRDSTLYAFGQKYFGTWQAAIEASGFDFHETIRNELDFGRRYPDKASVVAEIQRLAKEGKPLYRSAVLRYGDHALLLSGGEYFGSWPAAIEAAGLDREKARYKPSCRYPDMASVLKGIRRRVEAGLSLSAVSVHEGEHRESLLIASARKFFHTWRHAVVAAGIDPDAARSKKRGK